MTASFIGGPPVVIAAVEPGAVRVRWYRSPHNHRLYVNDSSPAPVPLDDLVGPVPFVTDGTAIITARHGRNGQVRTWYRSPRRDDEWLSFRAGRVSVASEQDLLDVRPSMKGLS